MTTGNDLLLPFLTRRGLIADNRFNPAALKHDVITLHQLSHQLASHLYALYQREISLVASLAGEEHAAVGTLVAVDIAILHRGWRPSHEPEIKVAHLNWLTGQAQAIAGRPTVLVASTLNDGEALAALRRAADELGRQAKLVGIGVLCNQCGKKGLEADFAPTPFASLLEL